MEKISAFFVILFLASSCMVNVTVAMPVIPCQEDEDCAVKYGRCKLGGMPICLHYLCSCYHEMDTSSSMTSKS
ncbi:unnamed protein product [Eruca vesicaria subsp. sativa]|uniref:Uncharacterized protein n=1 Tax=Eruca vesicaria subsp. sativa TaxID=29727 RepID=A0ABC8KFS3_ERUVS|nr:unnamed protein product [Eruca vesicaria subsp. sativa]